LQINPAVERKLVQQLDHIKAQRSKTRVNESLSKMRRAAEKENVSLMPYIIEAVKEYATLGEICGTLREVYGEYKPSSVF